MCRQRNTTRNGNDLESGSLLEPIGNNGANNTSGITDSGTTTNQSNGEVV